MKSTTTWLFSNVLYFFLFVKSYGPLAGKWHQDCRSKNEFNYWQLLRDGLH